VLKVRNLRKSFVSEGGMVHAVDDVTFTVASGEFFTLLGPSGCGKSTTLRCVAGLESISSGEIEIDGEVVASESRFVEANRRPISMVFQSYAIWPHMTVLENVMFPLSYRRSGKSGWSNRNERRERGMEALKMVQLDHLADRDAPFLSGGQQQRVALARSLVVRPKLLLLDEPLSNLDATLREEMRFEIKELTGQLGITTIYVTHDQAEALSMSDRIAVMSGGKILQLGSSREIYLEPVSPSVARIVGSVNVLQGTVVASVDSLHETEVRLASGSVLRCRRGEARTGEGSVEVLFRPELVGVRLGHGPGDQADRPVDGGSMNAMRARVNRVDFTGDHLKVHFETADGQVIAKLAPDLVLSKGGDVTLLIKAENCVAQ
jgi:iron(III) transport system ATP-binding protein